MTAEPPSGDDVFVGKRRRLRLSIAHTLRLGLPLLFLASLVTSFSFAFDAAWRNTVELERDLAELTVEAAIREVNTHLGAAQEQVEFLRALIERGEVDIGDERRLTDLLAGALAAAPQVSGLALVRADYSVLRAGRRGGELVTFGGNWADREDIREAMSNASYLQGPAWREIDWIEDFQAPHVVVAEPLMRDQKPIGLIFSIVSLSALSSFLGDFDAANGTHSFILYGREQVLAHASLGNGFSGLSDGKPLPFLGEVDDDVLAAIWGEVVDDMAYILNDSSISGQVVRGPEDDYVFFYRQLEIYGQQPWIVGVYFLGQEVDTPILRLRNAAVIGLVVLFVAVGAGFGMADSIVRPLRRLSGAAQAVRRLELDRIQPLGASLFSELDVAVKAFNSMLAGLKLFETYVPKSLVLRLMSSGAVSMRSEEREVTVLFTDIVDFTRIGARLPPARLAALLNEHFTLLAEAIEAEEGTLDKYIGDSIMAFWGAPLDQPDHAARACRAAQDIARRVSAENTRRLAAGEAALKLRVGIHSGAAIVGNVGAPGRVNYTLIGDTVNIAQRLEGLGKETSSDAEVAVLLSADTRSALDTGFAVEPLGPFVLRGRDEPLEVYRLILPEGGDPS